MISKKYNLNKMMIKIMKKYLKNKINIPNKLLLQSSQNKICKSKNYNIYTRLENTFLILKMKNLYK